MKKVLLGWNGFYGFETFKVNVPYECSIEEVKEIVEKENPTYKYWIEEIPKDMDVEDYISNLYKEVEE